MQTEWEATFWPIEKNEMRARLTAAGAKLIYPERLMRRVNLYPPGDPETTKGFARVRDEGDRITMTYKDMSGTKIEEQLEAEVVVNDFDQAQEILRALGCRHKSYQETKRELWHLDGVEVTIDEWPFLKPHVEIEGSSEADVRAAAEKLRFAWEEARFCSADRLYAEQHGVEPRWVNESIPHLTFDAPDPFQKTG